MIPIDVTRQLSEMGMTILPGQGKEIVIDKLARTITVGEKAKAKSIRTMIKQFNTKPFQQRREEEREQLRLAIIKNNEETTYRHAKDVARAVADAAELLSQTNSIDGRLFSFRVQKHVDVFGVELPEKIKLLTRYGNEYTIFVDYQGCNDKHLGTWHMRKKTITITALSDKEWSNHDRGDTFIHEVGHAWNQHSGTFDEENATRLAHECEAEAFVLMAYEAFLDVPTSLAIEHTGQMISQFARSEHSKWYIAANQGKED